MLGIDPLSVKVIPRGTLASYEEKFGYPISKINASRHDELTVLRLAEQNNGEEGIKC